MNAKKNRTGFTLIELLVVITIISILGAIILGSMAAVQTTTKKNLTAARLQLLASALNRYESDFDDYPPSNSDDGIKGALSLYECLLTEKKNGPYVKLSDVPTCDATGQNESAFADAWGKPIYYFHHRDYRNQPPNKREYRLISCGPDRQFNNGEKDSDDIVNWNKEKATEQ